MDKENMMVSKKTDKSNKGIKSKFKGILEKFKKENENDKTFHRRMKKNELRINFLGIVVTVIIALIAKDTISQYYSFTENIKNDGTINSAKTINNNYEYGEKIPTTQMLQNALNYYKNEQYEDAFNEYVKCINDSAIANLNIGYLYSHGLGCDISYEQAIHHYKEAVKLGMREQGIKNYLALNLVRPTNLELTIEALKYGFNEDDKNTIRYLSYLQTGIMYEDFQDNCYENAKIIKEKFDKNEQLNLEEHLLVSSVEIQKIYNGYVPQNTIFRKYSKYANGGERFVAGTTSKLILENGEYRAVLVNLWDFTMLEYYVVTNYKFNFSDKVFSEEFYEYIK